MFGFSSREGLTPGDGKFSCGIVFVTASLPDVGWLGPAPREDPPHWGEAGLGLLPAALNPPRTAPGAAVDQRKAKQHRAQKLQKPLELKSCS